jgi:hypothetical protein
LFEIDEKNPDFLNIWKKKYPCVETCKKLERLCNALETVMNLEEMEILYKSGIVNVA